MKILSGVDLACNGATMVRSAETIHKAASLLASIPATEVSAASFHSDVSILSESQMEVIDLASREVKTAVMGLKYLAKGFC